MVNSFGINVDVIKYFCCISIITQPLKRCQQYMESFENQIWIVCSEINAITFWHREAIFSISNAYPQEAEEPVGLWPDPGLDVRKREPSGRLRGSHGHPGPAIFLPQDEGRRSIPLGCFNATGSTAAKQQQGQPYFQAPREISFLPIIPVIPRGTILLPELSVSAFSLMCSVCPNKNTRETIYLQPTVFRDSKGVCNISERT